MYLPFASMAEALAAAPVWARVPIDRDSATDTECRHGSRQFLTSKIWATGQKPDFYQTTLACASLESISCIVSALAPGWSNNGLQILTYIKTIQSWGIESRALNIFFRVVIAIPLTIHLYFHSSNLWRDIVPVRKISMKVAILVIVGGRIGALCIKAGIWIMPSARKNTR